MSANATEALILRDLTEGVLTLTLNRPAQYNALSHAMLDRLADEIASSNANRAIRCVVLAASGKAFCAGHDLREMRAMPDVQAYRHLFEKCSKVMLALQALPVPVIAKVQGLATAAGCQLVAACDLAIAARSARFAVSGINVGLFCATPSVALSRNVSAKRAFDMLVTGDFIAADVAADWGLINEVVADEQLDEAVLAKARKIASKSPVALRHGKAMFYAQRQLPLAQAYALASETMAQNMMEEDAGEGIDAFLAKRKPVWRSGS